MPTIKLTKKLIETYPIPRDKPVELWDTEQKGLLIKITPAGSRVFMGFYRTSDGTKRKPRIDTFGAITLDEARTAANKMLAKVALGQDPSGARQEARRAPTVRDLCDRFLKDHARNHSKPSYLKQQERMIESRIKPELGAKKVAMVTRTDVIALHNKLRKTPYEANRVLALLSVMCKHAELWGLRPEGSNPCRLVQRFREKRRERLLLDAEVAAILDVLDKAEADGTETTSTALAIRLLFATGSRASEILDFRWNYIHKAAGEIVWPDSKTGHSLRKPLTAEIVALLDGAKRIVGNPFVCVDTSRKGALPMSSLEKSWRRTLEAAEVKHCGLHAIRHRAVTDIANNPAIPIDVAMKLTGHRTVTTFMRYVHSHKEQAHDAAEKVSEQRAAAIEAARQKRANVTSLPAR